MSSDRPRRVCVSSPGDCGNVSLPASASPTRRSPGSSTCSRSTSTPARSRPDGHYVATSSVGAARAVPRRAGRRRAPSGASSGSRASTRDDWDAYERFNQRAAARRGRGGHVPPGRRSTASRACCGIARGRGREADGSVLITRHHLRRHLAPRGGGQAGGGQRPLHAPARRRRRARLPRLAHPGRPPGGAVPGPGRRPAARRRRARSRDGELGGRAPPRRPRRPTTRSTRALAAGEDADVEYRLRRRRRHHALGARPRARPPQPGRHDRGQRHRLRRHRAPPHARRAGARRTRRCRRSSTRWTPTCTRSASTPTAATAPSTAARTARRWSAARCPAATTTTACASRSCIPTTASAGGGGRRGSPRRADRARVPACRPRRQRAHRLDRLRPRRDADGTLSTTASAATSPSAGGSRTSCAQHGRHARARELDRPRGELRARTDELTGTFNRRHFTEIVEAALARRTRPAAVCCCSTPTTSSRSTTPTATSSATRCSSSSRAGCSGRARPGRLPGALGRRGVRGAAARRRAPTTSSHGRAERLRAAVAPHARRRRPASACA